MTVAGVRRTTSGVVHRDLTAAAGEWDVWLVGGGELVGELAADGGLACARYGVV